MRSKFLYLFLFTITGLSVLAQTPKLAVSVPANMKQFVLKGYQVLNITKGDLNRDAYSDAVMVLYKKGEERTSDVISHPEKRPLLILLGQAENTYKVASRSDNTVYCVDCGGQMGDPFTGVVIKNGYFSVEHYGGSAQRWTRIITFKFNAATKKWLLHKDGHEYFDATAPDKSVSEVQTVKNFGNVPFEKFDIYKDH